MAEMTECEAVERLFATATFTAKAGEWFDAGTTPKLLNAMYLLVSGQPCGLFEGLRGGKPDEEICSFSEFTVTWPDESIKETT